MKVTDAAVFSRNHRHYLEQASARAVDEPTTFRSNVPWVSAANAIEKHGPRTIYFAPIDGGGRIEYQGDLVEVQVDPSKSHPVSQRLLSYALKDTSTEELWENTVLTLYVVANCHKLKKPFPQTRLRKLSDDCPLDENYIRSYALVHELESAE